MDKQKVQHETIYLRRTEGIWEALTNSPFGWLPTTFSAPFTFEAVAAALRKANPGCAVEPY